SRLSKMSITSRSYSQRFVGQKTMSVYGGAGGYDTRISTPPIGHSYYSSGALNLADGLDLHVDANEKAMLQNMNDRLASYIQKVRKLEENEHLDRQIEEWYMSKTVITHDYSAYLATIADLQDKEMTLLKTQMGGQVNVEIDGPSPIDLNLVMKEIRENYEALIAKKRKEL
ncbi:hypothetical protein GOODEAATRI_032332, partial [Goodea atripinnis]